MSLPNSSGLVHRHDGHIEGYLNCIAIRHGWTRTFSLSPASVGNLDYANLERILELTTLKLRHVLLRIFVENPADSGLFSKVRPWKDDGSLQSVLVKEFFEGRMRDGGILRFEIRDGRKRVDEAGHDDDVLGESIEPGSMATEPLTTASQSSKGKTRNWFIRRTTGGTHGSSTHGMNDFASEPDMRMGIGDNGKSRTRRFFEFFGLLATPAPARSPFDDPLDFSQAHGGHEDAHELELERGNEARHEDDERQTLLRKRSTPKQGRFSQTSSPFFGSVHPKAVVSLNRARDQDHRSRDQDRERDQRPSTSQAGSFSDYGSTAAGGTRGGEGPAVPVKDRRGPLHAVQETTDAETDEEVIDPEDERERKLATKSSSNPLSLLLPLLKSSSNNSKSNSSNPPPKKLKRRAGKRNSNNNNDNRRNDARDEKLHFRGAEVIKRPEDAPFARSPASTPQPQSVSGSVSGGGGKTGNSSATPEGAPTNNSGDLLTGEEDPFRG